MRLINIFKKYPPLVITYLFTAGMYLVGIGPVSVIGRLFGVAFLGNYHSSSWVPFSASKSPDRMY